MKYQKSYKSVASSLEDASQAHIKYDKNKKLFGETEQDSEYNRATIDVEKQANRKYQRIFNQPPVPPRYEDPVKTYVEKQANNKYQLKERRSISVGQS